MKHPPHANCMTALFCYSAILTTSSAVYQSENVSDPTTCVGKENERKTTCLLVHCLLDGLQDTQNQTSITAILYICINYAKQEIKDCWAWDLQIQKTKWCLIEAVVLICQKSVDDWLVLFLSKTIVFILVFFLNIILHH